jgi:tetratricopeptide (TPR) repeat protein
MKLSHETPARRWAVLIPAWLVLGALIFGHAWYLQRYLGVAEGLGLRGAATAGTPLQSAYPGFAADAQTWVRHALTLLEGDQIRLRWTDIDNAPHGREVHWNSAWAWTIAGAGKLDHWLTGHPLPQAVERMTVWLPGLTLFAAIVLVSGWAARRTGLLGGLLVAIAMGGHNRFYEGFFPAYVDHHGLIAASVFVLVLGVVFMGVGWWRPAGAPEVALPDSPRLVRRAAVVSALGGAFGLWVGAASVIPTIAFIGLAAALVTLVAGRRAAAEGFQFDPEAWRLWGRVGAGASVGFYLLEYFPQHLGFRLEVNHPFYALAWLGAGELLAELSGWWLGGCRPALLRWPRLALAAGLAAVAPVTILLFKAQVFTVADPFLAALHHQHIQEFLPLAKTLARLGTRPFIDVAIIENIPLILALLALLFSRRRPLILLFSTAVGILALGLSFWQSRWLLNTTGPFIVLSLVLAVVYFRGARPALRWGVVLVAATILYGVNSVRRILMAREDVVEMRISPADAYSPLFRDVARALRATQPTGDIVLVSSPNSSTGIGYYGRFKTLGTLYWENNTGLKAAGSILAARSVDEAKELIRKHGVTHLAILSEENFIGPYFKLLHPTLPDEDLKKTFGHLLLVDKVVPTWLQAIPYRLPDEFKSLNLFVLLVKVAWDQTEADAIFNVALTKLELGETAAAEKDFDTLIQALPQAPQPWFKKADIQFERNEFEASARSLVEAIRRSPGTERPAMYANAAANFYRAQRPAEAMFLYRTALAERADPNLATYLAWVLSTCKVDALRNGAEAVRWAEEAVRADPSSATFLNTLAAALAEQGRFPEAVRTAEEALAAARKANDAGTAKLTEARLEAFRAGRAWRE